MGGEHNLVMPSANEQIRGVDFMVKHPNYTHGDASVGGMAVGGPLRALRTVVDSSNLHVQTPESNDLALLKLKRPMEETDYVKVRLLFPSYDKIRCLSRYRHLTSNCRC